MGSVTHTFRVAEQFFRLSGDERLLMAAPNMAPFRVPNDSCANTDLRFAIAVRTVAQLVEPESMEPFFTDNSEADMPRIEIYRSADEWLFRIAQVAAAPVCCEVTMNKDFRHAVLVIPDAAPMHMQRFAIDNAAMLMFAFATAHVGLLEMHASVVVHEGQARLFLGHSGTGKSTHARQWLALYHTAYLLNDDNPVLQVDAEGKVWVYGSPWSGKTPCYRCERVPVAAIIQLEQAPQNEIARLAPSHAYAYMLSSCSGMKVLHEAMDGLHSTISGVVMGVPMFKLRCLPDKDSAQLCYQATR